MLPRFGPDVVKAFRKKVGFLAQAESEVDLRNYKALHFEKLQGGVLVSIRSGSIAGGGSSCGLRPMPKAGCWSLSRLSITTREVIRDYG